MDQHISGLLIGASISQISSIVALLIKHWLDRRMVEWKEQRLAARVVRDRRLNDLTEELGLEDPTWLANRLARYRGHLSGLLPELDQRDIRCLIQYIGLEAFQSFLETFAADATVDERVFGKPILQNIAEPSVLSPARRQAIAEANDFHIIHPEPLAG